MSEDFQKMSALKNVAKLSEYSTYYSIQGEVAQLQYNFTFERLFSKNYSRSKTSNTRGRAQGEHLRICHACQHSTEEATCSPRRILLATHLKFAKDHVGEPEDYYKKDVFLTA